MYCHLRPKKLQYAVAPPPVGEADAAASSSKNSNQPSNGAMVLATEPVRRLGELTLTALHEDIDKVMEAWTTRIARKQCGDICLVFETELGSFLTTLC